MRRGLRSLADGRTVFFIDASRVFDQESASVFTDFWHFPDPGHALLADFLADQLAPVLIERSHVEGASAAGSRP